MADLTKHPILPYLTVADSKESIEFYKAAFGAKLAEDPIEEDGVITHAALNIGNGVIMIAPEGAWGSPKKSPKSLKQDCSMGLYLYIDKVDDFFTNAKNNSATVISEPQDMFWGDRMCILKDINGFEWSFATALEV